MKRPIDLTGIYGELIVDWSIVQGLERITKEHYSEGLMVTKVYLADSKGLQVVFARETPSEIMARAERDWGSNYG